MHNGNREKQRCMCKIERKGKQQYKSNLSSFIFFSCLFCWEKDGFVEYFSSFDDNKIFIKKNKIKFANICPSVLNHSLKFV
jgi:hypothetical protein